MSRFKNGHSSIVLQATGAYGVPRFTRDLKLLVAMNVDGGLNAVIAQLDPLATFQAQVGIPPM